MVTACNSSVLSSHFEEYMGRWRLEMDVLAVGGGPRLQVVSDAGLWLVGPGVCQHGGGGGPEVDLQ